MSKIFKNIRTLFFGSSKEHEDRMTKLNELESVLSGMINPPTKAIVTSLNFTRNNELRTYTGAVYFTDGYNSVSRGLCNNSTIMSIVDFVGVYEVIRAVDKDLEDSDVIRVQAIFLNPEEKLLNINYTFDEVWKNLQIPYHEVLQKRLFNSKALEDLAEKTRHE